MRLKLTIPALLASSFIMAQQADSPVSLSLDDCLRVALSDNPTVRVADMEISRTDYSKIETISQLLPQVSFAGTYSRTLAKQVMYMNMDGFGGMGGDGEDAGDSPTSRASGGGGGIKVGLDNSYQVGFSASLPLIAPQLWASLKLSDNQILQAVEKARESKLELVNQVKNAYYTLLLAEDSKKVIQESYDMAALTHEIYTKQHAAGAASDYDVLRTSVAMKNVEPDLMQADIAIKQARLQLLLLMGADATTRFNVADNLRNYEKTMYNDVLAIDPDYSSNSSLVLNRLQSEQLDQALKAERASLYPTLSASFNYMWSSMSNGTPFKNFRWTPFSSAGLTLNVPIFTGGSRYSRIKQAKIQKEQMGWQRENLERSVAMQVDLAIDNIKVNVEQIASCSESVGQAERAHDIMEKSFGIGAASYLDLRDSELALTQSRLAYYQAIYNYLVAGADLELLLGNAPIENYIPAK
ncbi:MAG: TolC family protein [Bacteroides sp.]|uniref:TolC family protein n=1 Tax=uncultured Muribaculum sp. TaxID=1918613 RepID=UPI000AC7BB31|nr:TolC family protein [uncultured Muribaculum sp.]MCM1317560.1 TolC family protein [Bacteroides sp.]MCM1457373.1 TolC family protein [Lachnoclostridium sp.]